MTCAYAKIIERLSAANRVPRLVEELVERIGALCRQPRRRVASPCCSSARRATRSACAYSLGSCASASRRIDGVSRSAISARAWSIVSSQPARGSVAGECSSFRQCSISRRSWLLTALRRSSPKSSTSWARCSRSSGPFQRSADSRRSAAACSRLHDRSLRRRALSVALPRRSGLLGDQPSRERAVGEEAMARPLGPPGSPPARGRAGRSAWRSK